MRGASGRVLRDLARTLAKEGWQVTVITTGPQKIVERDGAVKIIRLKAPARPKGIFSYISIWVRMMIEGLKLPSTHLIVTMTDPPLLSLVGSVLSHFKKNRHIHWCQDLYPDVLPSMGMHMPVFMMDMFYGLSRWAMKKADKVIVIGRCMARHLSQDGFDPKQITVIPNWPDQELVQKGVNAHDAALEAAYASTGMSQDRDESVYREYADQVKYGLKFRILYAGNIGRAHPLETILNAAEMLCHEQDDIEFIFVGDGENFDKLAHERSVRHLDNVRLLPYQPINRLKELMESGDVHLMSMAGDAAGMIVPSKLYSALAAQRPCIFVGPTQSEAAKVINDYQAGSVVNQGDAEVLAEEIRQMRHNSDKWFHAHEGAAKAAGIYRPEELINAWIERAWAVVEPEIRD
ncbi:MAG: glycosyltransferase family 4 protein [Micavibrio sp.]|nr:glycosyltransferase family 4 protein [Micavibrio sp.]